MRLLMFTKLIGILKPMAVQYLQPKPLMRHFNNNLYAALKEPDPDELTGIEETPNSAFMNLLLDNSDCLGLILQHAPNNLPTLALTARGFNISITENETLKKTIVLFKKITIQAISLLKANKDDSDSVAKTIRTLARIYKYCPTSVQTKIRQHILLCNENTKIQGAAVKALADIYKDCSANILFWLTHYLFLF